MIGLVKKSLIFVTFPIMVLVLGMVQFVSYAQVELEQPLQINIFPSQKQQKEVEVKPPPPQVTVLPSDLSNKEILYLGGLADPGDTILIILQRGKEIIITAQVEADESGGWFYTHKGFLSEGNYKVLARVRNAEGLLSDTTEPLELDVIGAAIEFGSYRVSFQSLYITTIGILSLLVTIFLLAVIIMSVRIRHKNRRLQKEVLEVHQSVKKGFQILEDDIHKELTVLRELEKGRELSSEERARQAKLLKDLEFAERYIEKEIIDVEKLI